jgi:pyroglutamyl-peptidase
VQNGIAVKALVTGFEAFGGEEVNPSIEAVRLLPPRIGGLELATCALPTAFGRSRAELERAIAAAEPDIVLCVGLAGGRTELSLERVAINVDDARIPDNDGHQPIDRPIIADGPAAYFATLPIKAATVALRAAGLPAAISNSAGTFVCNHIFYGLMHLAATRRRPFRGGFLHIPYVPSQAVRCPGSPSLALDAVVRGIEIILAVSVEREADISVSEGAIS